MRFGKVIRPEGVKEFDRAVFWTFAVLPTWDILNSEWVWLERFAQLHYWSESDAGWAAAFRGQSATFCGKPYAYDCRTEAR